jgi:hypothetical protein
VGYPGGRFWSSFVFNNIVGCTFILSYRLSPFPAADNPGSPATETTRLLKQQSRLLKKCRAETLIAFSKFFVAPLIRMTERLDANACRRGERYA